MLTADHFASLFANFDGHTVGNFSIVCKRWNDFVKDPMVWRFICLNIWKDERLQYFTGDWKMLYMSNPHIRYDGCYVLETTSTRPGGYTDLGSRPTRMVNVSYYRYLHFLPGRKVVYGLLNALPEFPLRRPLPLTYKGLTVGDFSLAEPGITIRFRTHQTQTMSLSFWQTKAYLHDRLIVEEFHGYEADEDRQFLNPTNYFHFCPEFVDWRH